MVKSVDNLLKDLGVKLRNSKTIKLVFISFCLMFISGFPSEAKGMGASLYLSPPSGTYTVGSNFSVKVKVNSGGAPINVVEGTLVFNPDEVSVVNISKSDSIFSLWTTEPTFSNSAGNIVFGGGTPSSFSGNSGTIITVTFKAKVSSLARVSFSSGSVLAADGKGTNILSNMNGGIYTLKPKAIIPPPEEVSPEEESFLPTAGVPLAPKVSSSTHSDSNKWYSNNDPEFSWEVPSDVTAVKLLISHLPGDIPTVLYTPPISEKKLEDLEDGVWYFHIRFKNKYGWGNVLHRKVLIDTQPPEPFEIKVDNGGDPTNPAPILHFKTEDSLSGVEYYEIKIGEAEITTITAADIKDSPYKMPLQTPGKHSIIVKAVDAAGNFTLATNEVVIKPLEKPVITDFPKRFNAGDVLTIQGISLYPEAIVSVFVKKGGEEVVVNKVKTDSEGNWIYIHPKSLEKGAYQVWAQITDKRGAKSDSTEKITIAVVLPSLLKFGKIAIAYLSVMVTLAVLVIVLMGIIFYIRHRISESRKKLRRETKEAAQNLAIAFKALREEVQEQIEYLDRKKGLTKREKEIRDKLQEALDISEEFIGKEIRDIEKELK